MTLYIPHKKIKAALERLGAVDIYIVSGDKAQEEFSERDMDQLWTPEGYVHNDAKYFCEITWGCGDMDTPPSKYQLKRPHVFNGVDFALCDFGETIEDVVKNCLRNLMISGYDRENDWDAPSKVLERVCMDREELQEIIDSI